MLLTQAIELVVKDTRENTDPEFTISQAVKYVREELDIEEITSWVDMFDKELIDSYHEVVRASDAEIEQAIGLVTVVAPEAGL